MIDISFRRMAAVMVKETRHILRDAQTLFIVLCMPAAMMFLYGYALTTDVSQVQIAIEDPVPSAESRELAGALDATTMFSVQRVVPVVKDPREFFRGYRVKAIFRIPPGFIHRLRQGAKASPIQVIIDGSDPNLATIIINACEAAVMKPILRTLNIEKPEVVEIQQTILYNPRQRSAVYFVPGLMVLILTMISALLTSVALTREKELGTMAQLIVSPLRPFEVVAGKLIPYTLLAAVDGAMVLLIGRWVFQVAINGNAFLLAALSVLYIVVSLSVGLLISAVTHKQAHAMIAAIVVTLMPTVILTGFIFPVRSMPAPLQWLSAALPPTYYMKIVRGVILKGVGIEVLWKPAAVLCAQALILISIAVRKFRMAA